MILMKKKVDIQQGSPVKSDVTERKKVQVQVQVAPGEPIPSVGPQLNDVL